MHSCSSWSWQIKTFLILLCIVAFIYATGLYEKIDFSWIHFSSQELHTTIATSYPKSVLLYIVSLMLIVALCLPAVIPVVIASGYLFGLFLGALYSVIATVIGALVPFLVVRYIAGSYIKEHYSKKFASFNRNIDKYGTTYVLMLHYLAIVPFFIINTFAALTTMSLATFVQLTVLGTFPVYLIYTFAGRELSEVKSFADLFSVPVMSSLLLLGLLSVTPMIVQRIKRRYDARQNEKKPYS